MVRGSVLSVPIGRSRTPAWDAARLTAASTQMLRSELLVVLCSCWPASALHLGLGPRLASRTRPPRACAPKYDVAASTDYWAASNLLHDTFGGRTAYYWTTLRAPALNANVFFSPSESVCALATPSDDGAEPLGVVQLLLVELRKEAGSGAGKTVAFVQSVAVPPASRRQGVATRLVGWCEEEAGRRWGAVELWLALRTDNEAAQALYTGLGYEVVEERLGLLLMRKVPGPMALQSPVLRETAAAAAASATATASATASVAAVAAETATVPSDPVAPSLSPLSTTPPPAGGDGASGGVGLVELGKNLAAQACA